MKELSIDEIKKVSLDILVDVHEFCVKNNIKYSLAYGTLIGALRHKGFIPWDDDIDIIMPRPDFDRFFREYKSNNGYKALSPDDKDSLIMFGRVYDAQKTVVKTTAPYSTFETGLWIDVFPVDGVEDDEAAFVKRVNGLKITAMRIGLKRTSREGFWKTRTVRRKMTWIIKKLFTGWFDMSQLKAEYKQNICQYPYETSNYWGQLGCHDAGTIKEHNKKEEFESCVDVEFEGHVFKAMNGYDSILHRYYGEYMQLPPESERIPRIFNKDEVYWK
ncbi:MAG: LicD family protein [Bacteroidaceae bacterium]|nr:LicD family protein [Bacteroidaceae bacterium]